MMADTKTADTAKTTVPPVAPEAKPPAKISRLEAWEGFRDELTKRADEIGSQLPPTVTRERFVGAAIAAVKATPEILLATPRSLFSALTKAAQDGLLPDGREGIITVYNQKIRDTNPAQYENVAQWNPMFYGIRKRAREIDGIIIDAQVVVEGDDFDYELGDAPFIKHKPKARAEAIDASKGVAVYAIFRGEDGKILHREVMWKHEVFATMNQSKAKGSLMWTVFWTEGWRKAVGRRGAKSVPVSAPLARLITRDDEHFEFDRLPPAGGGTAALPQPAEPPAPLPEPDEPEPRSAASADDDFNQDDSAVSDAPPTPDEVLENLGYWFKGATTEEEIEEAWSELDIESTFSKDVERMGKAIDMKSEHLTRVAAAKPVAERTEAEQAAIDKQVDDLFPGARGV